MIIVAKLPAGSVRCSTSCVNLILSSLPPFEVNFLFSLAVINGPGAVDPDYEIAEITIYPECNDIYVNAHNLMQQRPQVRVRSKCICNLSLFKFRVFHLLWFIEVPPEVAHFSLWNDCLGLVVYCFLCLNFGYTLHIFIFKL